MNAAGPAKPTIKKFVYKARAIALRGSIRKPFYQELGEHAIVRHTPARKGPAGTVGKFLHPEVHPI